MTHRLTASQLAGTDRLTTVTQETAATKEPGEQRGRDRSTIGTVEKLVKQPRLNTW